MDPLVQYIMTAMGLNYQAAMTVAQAMTSGAIPFAPPTAATSEANAPTIMRALANPDKGTMTSPQRHLLPGLNGMEHDVLTKHLMGTYDLPADVSSNVAKDLIHQTTVGDAAWNMAWAGKKAQDDALAGSYYTKNNPPFSWQQLEQRPQNKTQKDEVETLDNLEVDKNGVYHVPTNYSPGTYLSDSMGKATRKGINRISEDATEGEEGLPMGTHRRLENSALAGYAKILGDKMSKKNSDE